MLKKSPWRLIAKFHLMGWLAVLLLLGSPLQAVTSGYQIIVKKAERKLELQQNGQLIKTYPIGLGLSPVGAKVQQGDRKTPEGEYFICNKNPQSQFYMSLGLNYPNSQDAKRGLAQKLINQQQYERIVSAERSKTIPPWNTRLGGEVFIHGRGSSSDWTWGCVALDDADIKELYNTVPVGTPVTILP